MANQSKRPGRTSLDGWRKRCRELAGQITEADAVLNAAKFDASNAVLDGATPEAITRLNVVVRECEVTLDTLRLAHGQAEAARLTARQLQDKRALATRKTQIADAQKQAQTEMHLAEEAWCAVVAHIKKADDHVQAIRGDGGVGRELGTLLNSRYERTAGWLARRIGTDLPLMREAVCQGLKNRGDGVPRQDRSANDCLPDFLEIWMQTYGAKLNGAGTRPGQSET